MKTFFIPLFLSLLIISCNSSKAKSDSQELNENISSVEVLQVSKKKKLIIDESKLISAYFASGCFWCVEAIYEHTKGVKEVISGYAGGHTENPTYESSNTGKTGHAEAVEVIYDSSIVSFKELVDIYYGTQNIEQVNGQGNDIGSQYRSIIFYSDEIEFEIINNKIAELKSIGLNPAAEVKENDRFWEAEGYHQDYERLHPNQSYIRAVSVPRLNRFKADFPELVK
ncbi:peptide-methionine (S)-S-oxide reductase MsrA [Flavobacteriales bacterium]|jgi:peptide-methionine (S)-S-oxide reductase|nr:peptide-methionine (S)-S-oxide reductase MsrA [Flavobacteriales bacterium]MDB4088648.1 peptide-methionine (S)-S-oxide reductase MsrA [Flavobacteriales bacterium]